MDNISIQSMIIRLTFAALAGLALGLERDIKRKPIDFRSNIIVSITGALAVMTMLQLASTMPLDKPGLGLDPTRSVQAVLMGLAFLGSATILKRDTRVIGTATGATVWACGGIGVTFGCGFYVMGILATTYIFATLTIIGLWRPDVSAKNDIIEQDQSRET